jgi:hypothetical protein
MTLKAGVQVATQRFKEAHETAQSAREMLEISLPPEHWRVAAAANVEGAALTGLGAYDEAEQLLLQSNEILADAPMPGVAEQSEQRLVALYTSWGKEEKARKFASSN